MGVDGATAPVIVLVAVWGLEPERGRVAQGAQCLAQSARAVLFVGRGGGAGYWRLVLRVQMGIRRSGGNDGQRVGGVVVIRRRGRSGSWCRHWGLAHVRQVEVVH